MTPFRRRRPGRRLPVALVLALPAVAVTAAGCSGGVAAMSVPVPKPAAPQARICKALSARLPHEVAGLGRRDLDPESPLTAGWGSGDRWVVMRCGIPRPAAMVQQSTGVEADGVDWLAQQPSTGWVFTTASRRAYVQVTLGKGFQDGTLIADFADAVKKSDPLVP